MAANTTIGGDIEINTLGTWTNNAGTLGTSVRSLPQDVCPNPVSVSRPVSY